MAEQRGTNQVACLRCGYALTTVHDTCPRCDAAEAGIALPRPGVRKAAGPLAVIGLLVLGAFGLVGWYWWQRQAPVRAVDRFCEAVRKGEWRAAYGLIDWPEGTAHPDEKRFTSTAEVSRAFFIIDRYELGAAKVREGQVVIPVTVTATISAPFGGTATKTDTLEVEPRLIGKEWKVRPRIKAGFMGLGNLLSGFGR